SEERIFQRDESGTAEKAQGYERPTAHALAHCRRDAIDATTFNELSDEQYVGRVHQEENRRIEGNRLWRQFADGHPGSGERKERYGKQVREIEPRSEEHTSELQSRGHLVCRLLL